MTERAIAPERVRPSSDQRRKGRGRTPEDRQFGELCPVRSLHIPPLRQPGHPIPTAGGKPTGGCWTTRLAIFILCEDGEAAIDDFNPKILGGTGDDDPREKKEGGERVSVRGGQDRDEKLNMSAEAGGDYNLEQD
jgi:hypothetical protein